MKRVALDDSGVLHLPIALMATIFFVTALGLWGLLHHWKGLARIQLHLDQCSGETALDLKEKLQTISSANRQITALRLSEEAAPDPRIKAAIQLAIGAEVFRQEAARTEWTVIRVSWAAQVGCGARGDLSFPLPSLSWTRDPPDSLGPQALRLDRLPKSFRVRIDHSPRSSAAEVSSGDPYERDSWHARWIPPQGIGWTSLR